MQLNQPWIWQHNDWPQFRWEATQLSHALAQGKVIGMSQSLNADLTLEALSTILIEDGLTTSAIDGLIELLLDATQNHTQPLSLERLYVWHRALFPTAQSSLRSILTGQLRGGLPMRVVSGRIGRETVHFQVPQNTQLMGEMNAFLNEFNHPTTPTDGLIRAGIAHLWFITIHPFEDGNGRIARALTDMALAQNDGQTMRLFSLSTQILKQRNEYYAILDTTQRGDLDITAWLLWFLQQIQAAANQAQKTIANTLVKTRFWLRHQQTQPTPTQSHQPHVRRAK